MRNVSVLTNAWPGRETPSLDILPIAMYPKNDTETDGTKHLQCSYEIIWVQEGSGTHTINQINYQLSANRVYCTVPGQRHQLQVDPGSKGFIISFTESFLNCHYNEYSDLNEEHFFHHLLQHPELIIGEDVAEDMQDVLLLLLKETSKKIALSNELAIKYLKIFLIYLQRQLHSDSATTSSPKNNALIKHFQWLLENNFREKKAVAQYAKDLFVTPNHLNRVLREFTGFSARQLIKQRIILEAKKKAKERGSSMKEIAYDLGFTDIAHFSKYFKNTSGVNFSSFKKETISYSLTAS